MKKKLLSISDSSEPSKYKENYYHYKNSQKDSKNPFVIIDKDLYKYLPYLSNGSVKLYMLYVFQAKNETGESWHSVQSQADILQVSKRSIDNWNKELVELGLIARIANNKNSTSTFLLPLSDYSIKNNNESMIIFDKKQNKDIDGQLKYIFFLFQYYFTGQENNKEAKLYTEVAYIYENKIEFNNSNIIKRKIVNQIPNGAVKLSISSSEVTNDIYVIKDINFIEGEYKEYFSSINDLSMYGFVISNKFNLFDKRTNLNLTSELADVIENNEIDLFPSINF